MRLAEFIVQNEEQISSEWETFASTLKANSRVALRDHIGPILHAIAVNIGTVQSESERSAKSMGQSDNDGARVQEASHLHAIERAAQKYSIEDLVAEFRALRASVTKLWSAHQRACVERHGNEDLVRFNEAIDQLLAESVSEFAREVQESRDMFLAILGHDLRNPLSAIANYAEALKHASDLPGPRVQAVAGRILDSVKRIVSMVSGLLDVTRTRFGTQLPIERSQMELGQLCEDVVGETRAARPGVDIRLQKAGALPGNWDRVRLSQMLSNLIVNAAVHGDTSKPIDVSAAGNDREVVVEVHNGGRAIAPEMMVTMFQAFTRSESEDADASAADGLGLGLYIAHQIALAHGGTIDVESSAATGTTFRVSLPRGAP